MTDDLLEQVKAGSARWAAAVAEGPEALRAAGWPVTYFVRCSVQGGGMGSKGDGWWELPTPANAPSRFFSEGEALAAWALARPEVGPLRRQDARGLFPGGLSGLRSALERSGARTVSLAPDEGKPTGFDCVWSGGWCQAHSTWSGEVFIQVVGDARVWDVVDPIFAGLAEAPRDTIENMYLLAGNPGLELQRAPMRKAPFVPSNYGASVASGFGQMAASLMAGGAAGRLHLLHGPPGTGKTYLLRALFGEVEGASFVWVPPSLVPQLQSPAMLRFLVCGGAPARQEGPLVLVIEDGDMALITRGADNMTSVHALLSLADGLLGSALDLGVIVTTNADRLQMDPAVRRAGRLALELEFELLAPEQARAVAEREGKRVPDGWPEGPVPLAEAYALPSLGDEEGTST